MTGAALALSCSVLEKGLIVSTSQGRVEIDKNNRGSLSKR
jgi:hypothetical protein